MFLAVFSVVTTGKIQRGCDDGLIAVWLRLRGSVDEAYTYCD